MSNKIKYMEIKNHTYYFLDDTINIKKIFIQVKFKQMKSYTKTFLFTRLDI